MQNDMTGAPPQSGTFSSPSLPPRPGIFLENLDNIMQEISQDSTADSPQSPEQYNGLTFVDVLVKSIGYFAVCEFIIGTSGIEEKSGILFAAGNSYVTLFDRETDSYTICDMYSLKFVTIYNSRVRPPNFARQNNRTRQNGNTGHPMR